MEIIKHGIFYPVLPGSEYDKKIKRFECKNKACGCVFDAEKTEYKEYYPVAIPSNFPELDKKEKRKAYMEAIKTHGVTYKCECPECGKMACFERATE